MNKIKILIVILSCCLSSVKAQDNKFDIILNQLVEDCPELNILKLNNKAVVETERALNRISSPEVSMEQVWGRNHVGNKFDAGINQSFDWPGLYKARAKAIGAQSTAFELQEQAALLDKIQEIRALMVDIIFQRKNLSLDSLVHTHMVALEKDACESYEKGEISKLEYKRTQLERIQTSIQLQETHRVLHELYSALETSTGKKDCWKLVTQITDPPSDWKILSEQVYEEKLTAYDPRMAYLKATVNSVEAISKAERMASTLPSFNLGYAFQREQDETFNGFNLSITLPIYGASHIRNASKANILMAELEIQAEQIGLLSKMRNQRRAALSLARELDDYSVIFEEGNYADLLKLALDGGQTDNMHYLQEINYYIEVTRQYLELQHQYNLALVSLNRFELL